MASVQDLKIVEALLTLLLAYNVVKIKEFNIVEIEALWLSCSEIWGMYISRVNISYFP